MWGASKRNGELFLRRKVKSDAFLIQYLQFLNIENAETVYHSEIRGHTPPTNLPLSSMEYLTLRNQIVNRNADLLVLWRGA
jgi:hypothetical protein